MKKIEALWEKLKNKGLVSNTEVNPLSLEERMQEKVNKLSKIKRPESREIIHSPIIPIEKSQVTQATVKNEAKEDWQIYEENKKNKIEKSDLASLKEELKKEVGKGKSSSKLVTIFKRIKEAEIPIFSTDCYFEWNRSLKLKEQTKEIIKKYIEKITKYFSLPLVGIEENRVLLN